MKDYIEERAMEIANYIIETKATVRQMAKKSESVIDGTYGCNKIERYERVIYEVK